MRLLSIGICWTGFVATTQNVESTTAVEVQMSDEAQQPVEVQQSDESVVGPIRDLRNIWERLRQIYGDSVPEDMDAYVSVDEDTETSRELNDDQIVQVVDSAGGNWVTLTEHFEP